MSSLGARIGAVGVVVGLGGGACETPAQHASPVVDAASPADAPKADVPAAASSPQTAKATFRAMQLAACDGDAPKLRAFVNEARLRELTTDDLRASSSSPFTLEELAERDRVGLPLPDERELRDRFAELGDEAFRHGMSALAEDIARGRAGAICGARLERATEMPQERAALVEWTTPAGEPRTWVFGQRERGWELIGASFHTPFLAERRREESSPRAPETKKQEEAAGKDLMDEMLGKPVP
jgi:hypothetical protein